MLNGKRLLITGVLSDMSIAFQVARIAQEQGAEIVLTSFGRALPITEEMTRLLPAPAPVIRLDVTRPEDLERLPLEVTRHLGALDGIMHSIAYAPPGALGGRFLDTPWQDAATALHVSAFSLQALTASCADVLEDGASVVGLDFDASLAWPGYDWMGVSKAALEAVARYLALYLAERHIRVNLVAAGMIRTVAARAIPNTDHLETIWRNRPPLSWDVSDPTPPARACILLLSDWLSATTGEILHVDGGLHAVMT
ncbi:enoyl-[acyl-carrier-protein] reductase [NADH] [Streptomyces sp. BK208]|nr:enoyl-[acyl-carrier-protein] reductase [NADH] [Streptomyces sp. BK208]